MARSFDVFTWQQNVLSYVGEQVEVVGTSCKEAVKDAAAKIARKTRDYSPVRTGKYKKSWTYKTTYENDLTINCVVYNKKYYYLVHLLEHGFHHASGKHVKAQPHVSTAIDEVYQDVENAISKAVKQLTLF